MAHWIVVIRNKQVTKAKVYFQSRGESRLYFKGFVSYE